ncbi:unnamed protein product [Macrosiphum euphorbiae]|uniref:Uncharacterized protein n=1 Tax=Macrosiphum euphorbiae TaxID=13131 RepID=A0AAV0WY28_9HEMI|nr:unnamed protein product [Macrosiphum euphorbiae]
MRFRKWISRGFPSPLLPESYVGPAKYVTWHPPTFSPESVGGTRFGFPAWQELYVGPAMYMAWQPPPPGLESIVVVGFSFPPKPPPEYYVGPVWFDVNGPPPLPCCAAASMFSHPPPPMRRSGSGAPTGSQNTAPS